MSAVIDLSGQRFGRLVAVDRVSNTRAGQARWLCRCDCGGQVETMGVSLRNNHTRSCGCLQRESCAGMGGMITLGNTRHGHARKGAETGTHRSWRAMRSRCNDPKNKHFKDYGGRGIRVCDRWLNDFENFLNDMGERPDGLTLDRKNNNGNYNPCNCRWATWQQQAANRRQRAA